MSPDLLERLRAQLRRDPSDRDVAFLLSLSVREPFVVYSDERVRLRRLGSMRGRSTRELLLVEAVEELLAKSATPSRSLRRPEPGSTDIVGLPPERARPAAVDESDLPRPKDIRECDTDPAPPAEED